MTIKTLNELIEYHGDMADAGADAMRHETTDAGRLFWKNNRDRHTRWASDLTGMRDVFLAVFSKPAQPKPSTST
jgi:hypothetical protein